METPPPFTDCRHPFKRHVNKMGDSEFSSVHWDSPPPSSIPDPSESNHVNSPNNFIPTSHPTQTVPPEMDPLQAPPSNEHILICVLSSPSPLSVLRELKLIGRMYLLLRRKRMELKMPTSHILLLPRFAAANFWECC